jgi:hypothetical protein
MASCCGAQDSQVAKVYVVTANSSQSAVIKPFRDDCPSVVITIDQNIADYNRKVLPHQGSFVVAALQNFQRGQSRLFRTQLHGSETL